MVTIDECGTIIEGTLRTQDIAEACLGWLRENASEAYQEISFQFKIEHNQNIQDVIGYWWERPDACEFLYEVVYPLMQEQAPDSYYFGAHPGDGSDIGFHLEAIDEEVVCSP